jgi:hypothetical protein
MVKKTVKKQEFKIVIEKDIPIPTHCSSVLISKLKNALNLLVPGESFLIPTELESKTLIWHISRYNKAERDMESGRIFITRKSENGRRVWRVK